MLDSQVQGVLALVRAALTGEARPLPADFDLEKAYDAILKHNIAVMALEGAVKCGLPKSDPTVRKLFAAAFRAIACVEAQDRAAAQVFAAFEAAGIDFMPVKGALLRDLYPKREYRSMGDMDVLVRLEQYDRIREIMVGLGWQEGHENEYELKWRSPGLMFEFHKGLFSPYDVDMFEYFRSGWQLAEKTNTSRYTMSEEDHYIYVFAHFARHYRDGGVGIRQMCDLWLQRSRVSDWSAVREGLLELDLLQFHDYVMQTLNVWFEKEEATEKTEFISVVIFESGSYGSAKMRMLADGVRITGEEEVSKLVRYKQAWYRMFPPFKKMRVKYPMLKKVPVLLPVMWIYRVIFIFINETEKIRHQRDSFYALAQEDVAVYQENLKYVGLSFKNKRDFKGYHDTK